MNIRLVATTLLLAGVAVDASVAQMDPEDEIRSLSGVRAYGLVIDLESALPEGAEGFEPSVWRERLSERLRALTGRAPSTNVDPTEDTHLYVHLNAMSVGEQLVPFSIKASFLQPVRIPGGRRMMAITWETGLVGLVSIGELGRVLEAAVGVVEEFASDLAQAEILD